MRRNLLAAAVLGAMLVAGVAMLVGCSAAGTGPSSSAATPSSSAPAGLSVGQSVAAVWTDGNLYLARITKVQGDQITVQYADDQSSRTIAAADARPISQKTWAPGDKVLAVWASGRFYSGVISRAVGASYEVTWDDGSDPSDVTAEKIIAR